MTKRTLPLFLSVVIVLGLLVPVPVQAAETHAGIVSTRGGSLNVRSSPSTGSGILTSLKNGSFLTLVSSSGNWWKVEYANGRYGYCHKDYVALQPGQKAVVATSGSNLNIRTGGGTHYPIAEKLSNGVSVTVLSAAKGWSRILYHGTKTGYVSSQYLSGSSNTGTIYLSVPSFKQTDSRWAGVPIGTSGKTMAQIGCATTAIAMMESYRTGNTITPDAMARKLRYTASGSVYWPSHYTAVTDGSGYLSKIHSLLLAGKPVLLGAKNIHGGQHWVVITGFSGGTLSPGSFAILDPGSSSRTNLQQFLNAYPTFYKYFHY